MNRTTRLALAIFLALFLCLALYVGMGSRLNRVVVPIAYAQASCCGIETGNEDPVPGDWDATYIFQGPAGFITRSNTYVQEGGYSYQHYSDCPSGICWAWAYITCTEQMTSGYFDIWTLMPAEPGHAGFAEHPIGGIGEEIPAPWNWIEAWELYYDYDEKRFRVACDVCMPDIDLALGAMITGTWQNTRVEWDLPFSSTAGSLKGWTNSQLWFDEQNIPTETDPSDWVLLESAATGVGGWQFTYSDEFDIFVDTVDISSCDPTPTPTPSPADACEQYGHAAVLNVDDDCSAVLRFRAVPNYVPFDATVQRATLHLWGAASEVLGETIYVAPLVPLWGEMTCDWCRRTVGESWADDGATNIPLDRYPGSVATFETALGWIEVDIPPYIVEDWALSSAANPGLILHNVDLTGKFGIASREWIDADYMPYMTIYYTD